MQRIMIFDGLRASCALWVAVVHLARLVGVQESFGIPDSRYGVEIFFILSGYVIASLLAERRESWYWFLFRRYCRLAPAFILFAILYLVQTDFIAYTLARLDVSQQPVRELIAIYISSARLWYLHLPAHALMIHGLLDNFLPGSSKAIMPEGWSITVEWQFYLIAPLLFTLMARNRLLLFVCFVSLLVLLSIFGPFNGSVVTGNLPSFLVGMCTCLVIHHNAARLKVSGATLSLLVLALLFASVHRHEFSIWFLFLAFAYGDVAPTAHRIFQAIFEHRVIQYLGKVSYSFYLCHMLAIYYTVRLVSGFINATNAPGLFFLVTLPLMLVIALLLSTASYRLVEQPLIRWSARVVARQQAVTA